jgi:hypothetical protein
MRRHDELHNKDTRRSFRTSKERFRGKGLGVWTKKEIFNLISEKKDCDLKCRIMQKPPDTSIYVIAVDHKKICMK